MENLSFCNGKHAYMIMAHKLDYTFQTLLSLLDDKRNDIFIHVDKKTADVNVAAVKRLVKNAGIELTENRTNVFWGGYSQIESELTLLKMATSRGRYQYYHLLSGADLPIKTQNEIHDFFDAAKQRQFIRFECPHFNYPERVRYYHFLQDRIGRRKEHPIYWMLFSPPYSILKEMVVSNTLRIIKVWVFII